MRLKGELPDGLLVSDTPRWPTLTQYLLNIQSSMDALRESQPHLRGRALSLLLSFVTEGMLWNAPVSCIRDAGYQINPYVRRYRDIREQFREFYQPLAKVSGIIRSYAAKPYSERPLSDTAFVDTTPEVPEAADELTEIYVRFHALPDTKKEIVRVNIQRLLRASVLHAPQFSILAYFLTVMFLQKRDILEQPASVDSNDTALYHYKVNSTGLKDISQEAGVNLFLQIRRVTQNHSMTNVASRETLEKLDPKERLPHMLAARETVFAAADVEYAPAKQVAAAASRLLHLNDGQTRWLEEQWKRLYYYRDSSGKPVNKKEIISQCAVCEEGKILTSLNTVLQPKNRIRILTDQKLDPESAQSLLRLYRQITSTHFEHDNGADTVDNRKMYTAVSKFFGLREQDISLLFFRMQCKYILIDETEIDPFEETLLESLHGSIADMLQCVQPRSYIAENWSYHIRSETRLQLLTLQNFLLRVKWSRTLHLSFCKRIDIQESSFHTEFPAFIREMDAKGKLNSFWEYWETSTFTIQNYILREAFQTFLLKTEEYFVEQIMTVIWDCICEGGFAI